MSNATSRDSTRLGGRWLAARFRAGLAFYPGCGSNSLLARKLKLDVPLMMLLGSNDEEVSATICREVAARASGPGGVPQVQWYEGATHDFDDPGKTRQSISANRSAHADALQRAAAFVDAAP